MNPRSDGSGAGRAESSATPDEVAIARLPFLLEVGSEEIPARFLPAAVTALREGFLALLEAERLGHGEVEVFAAPRRLALLCRELAVRQPDRTREVKGPPLSVAYDENGEPTAAGLGFARENGVDLAACFTLTAESGEFLAARKVEAGRPAAAVLAESLPELVLKLPFPKVMRWGESDLQYARPLQWLIVLLGEEVVPVELGDLKAGRESRGHRTLAGDRQVTIDSAEQYLSALRENGVVTDQAERRRLIEAGLAEVLAARSADTDWLRDEELLTEVVFLCENPTPFLGSYEAEFFELPEEVIVTALKAHQRYFAVVRKTDSKLLPLFAAVRDGGDLALDRVRLGNERVLRARLADALFYWQFDQQKSPDQHAASLQNVTWIEGFGSLADKIRRLQELVSRLWEDGLGSGGPVPADALRAAALCKSDLVSEMIKDGKEFTRLEGIIGARYAERAGESVAVCRAIERHYLPRVAGGELPGDAVSSVLAAADRLDTLAGCWLAGFVPTGAKDPYALRRQARALLRIVLDLQARIDLREFLENALALFTPLAGERDLRPVAAELKTFILTRFSRLLVEDRGCVPELVRAVLPAHGGDPTDAVAWIEALAGFRHQEDFLLLATGFKRCKNILEGQILAEEDLAGCLTRWQAGGEGVAGESFAALTAPAEQDLKKQVVAAIPSLVAQEESGDYVAIFEQLSRFGPAIDRFFDTVRVNVEDQGLRRLRHAFLREIHGLFARYADFSAVAPPEA